MRCKICGSEGVMEMQTMYELLGIHKKVDKEKQNVENSKNNNQSVLKGRFKRRRDARKRRLCNFG